MRIAIFHDLPSGGAKRSLFEEVKYLSKKHTIDVFTLSSADHNYCDIRPFVNNYKIYQFSPRRLFNSPFGRLNQFQRFLDLLKLDRLSHQIASVIDQSNYDVIFIHPCMWTQAPLVIRQLKSPVVYYLHEPPRHIYENNNRLIRRGLLSALDWIDPFLILYRCTARHLDRSATLKSNLVLVNSQFMKDVVKRIYQIEPVISYLGVDTDSFCVIPGIRKEGYVLSVGAIHTPKGYDFIIQSLGLIPLEHRPALKLVGNVKNEAEEDRLIEIARKNGVELSIEVNLNQTELVRRYNQASLFVYAPINEPFGLTPLEAMACGTPAVGVAEGGVKESILDGYTGMLVERDPEVMAGVIEELLANPERLAGLRKQAIDHVRLNWTRDAATKRIEVHLLSVVQ